jgi:CDP-4-dehydro-6-deoxyglucose reductase
MQEQPEWQRTVVYACGASVMVDSAAAALADAGLPPGRFFADAFVSSN